MKKILLFALLFQAQLSIGQQIDSLTLNNISDAVIELQNSILMRNGFIGFSLASVENGHTLFALNQEKSMPSASTLKLFSTATALSVLGVDYRYKTYLEQDGVLRNDTLVGSLYIRGTGDPTLGSDRFKNYPTYQKVINQCVQAVRQAGIRHITGGIVADNGLFDQKTLADSWNWGDIGNYYGAGANGININENLYQVTFRPGKAEGDKVELVGTTPVLHGPVLINLVTTGAAGSGDRVNIYAGPGTQEILLTGTVPRGSATFSVKGSLPESALFTATLLHKALVENRVTITSPPNKISGSVASARSVLHTFSSPTMLEICRQTNWWSVNIFADAVLKTASQRLSGATGFKEAIQSATAYWEGRGANLVGFYPKDGSGLSTSGSVTASNLTCLMNTIYPLPEFKDFFSTIAPLGQAGTVRNLAKRTRAEGNVRAKSGSIEGTRAYAGYVTTKSGALLSFSIIAHKYQPEQSSQAGKELVKIMVLLGEL